jgi:NADH-quinone oxidoreductase subunit A
MRSGRALEIATTLVKKRSNGKYMSPNVGSRRLILWGFYDYKKLSPFLAELLQKLTMLFDFANVLVFTALGLGFVGVNLLIGRLLRPANPQARKLSTYECGEPSTGSAWVNFNIRFYLVALIFIIFEVEIAFIFPVAVVFRNLIESGEGLFAFVKIFIFIGILFLGLIYSWVKGDLDWIKKVKA